jgi:crotonobetainyl-CoA:carnitine CoA-transferase CaiB-like acyl-CoA transferase
MGWVVSNYLNTGIDPLPMGNENFTAAPSGTFRTGKGLLNIAANEQRQFETLCDLIAGPELKTDPRFAGRQSRKVNREALRACIEERLVKRSAAEWETLFNDHGVPAGQIMSVPEILASPQLEERNFLELLPVLNSKGKPLRITRPGLVLEEAFPSPAPPPALGAHTRSWMLRLGLSEAEIEALRRDGVLACHDEASNATA